MAEFVADEEFFALVRKVSEQADEDISLHEVPRAAVFDAFNDGADIHSLAKRHSRFNAGKGRIFPFYDTDKGVNDVAEVSGVEEAVEDVVYQWHNLDNAVTFGSFVQAWGRLQDAVGALSTWHPDYDADLGVIV